MIETMLIMRKLEKAIRDDIRGKDHIVIKFKSYYNFEDQDIPIEKLLKKIAIKYTIKGHICNVYKDEYDTCLTFSFVR